jgi:hypothetical protein
MARRKKRRKFTFKNFEGREYEIIFKKPNSHHYGEADGTCQDPESESPKIYINPYLTKQSELNTSIHEVAHAFFWNASEAQIKKFGDTLSRFLYSYCKWRKLERRKYKQGDAHKSGLLEKPKGDKNESKTRAKKSARRTRKKA